MSFVSSVKRHLTSAKTVVVAAAAGAAAHANAAIDVGAITDAGADVALVGGAVFAVYVGAKVFKWVRSAL